MAERYVYEIVDQDSGLTVDVGEMDGEHPSVGTVVPLGRCNYRITSVSPGGSAVSGQSNDSLVIKAQIVPDDRAALAFHRSLWSWKRTDRLHDALREAGFSFADDRANIIEAGPNRGQHLDAKLIVTSNEQEAFRSAEAYDSALLVVNFREPTAKYYRGPYADPSEIALQVSSEHESRGRAGPTGSSTRRNSRLRLDPETAAIFDLIVLLLDERRVVLAPPPKAILTATFAYNDELLVRLARDITDLHQLTPRQFEEFVAELLSRDGFHVELTKKTRDGGIDILASRPERFGRILYGYECKKYRADRPIGVSIVRELATAARDNHCHLGVLCTTSTFTADAVSLAKRTGIVFPQDVLDLQRWVQDLVRSH